MVSKRDLNICRFILLILSVSMLGILCVVWWDVNRLDMTPPITTTLNTSNRRWKPWNPAMTTCIGYGTPQTTESSSFCKIRLPNAIIIGVTKCGTHTLLTFLGQHPQIVRNMDIMEYHFFEKHYANGIQWYRDRMPYSLPGQIVIENTPNYFERKDVPERMFNLDPKIKLILTVRNPVTRVISAYAMHKERHDKLNITLRGLKPGVDFPPLELIWRSYMHLLYDVSLKLWLKYFSLEQIHILDGDVLRKQPLRALQRIEQFLNIEPYFHEKHFYLNKTRGLTCLSQPRFNHSNCMSKGKGRKHPQINETVLQEMREYFRLHNERFYKITMRNFGWENDTAYLH